MTTFTLTGAARQAACDAIVDLLDGGTGSTANSEARVVVMDGAVDLCDVLLGTGDAFGGATTGGVATMTATSPTGSATAAGTADVFQLRDSGTTPVNIMNGDVGTAAATMIISNTSIAVSDVIKITSMTVTVPAS